MAAAKGKPRPAKNAPPQRAPLDQIVAFVSRYVVCTEAHRTAIALWVVHTHAIDVAEATPYLAVTSAEKQSGKSRLLEVIAQLVARPWHAIEPSDAVLFRKIERDKPTLLLDETDALFGPNTPSREPLRGLLNAGNRRGATVPRCVGEGSKIEVVDFDVFCAKAFAGIGRLPETIADRSIRIRLRRRSRNEIIERFVRREAEPLARSLKRRIEQWVTAHVAELKEARPVAPDGLSDRAVEGWEPLWAIADLAGGNWPERARRAGLELSTPGLEQEMSAGVRLLEDIRMVFTQRAVPRLTTAILVRELTRVPESPWHDWKGKGLNAHYLGRLLGQWEIGSTAWRTKSGVRRGYALDQFQDAFERYLPPLRLTRKGNCNKRNRC
jgi:hypothetical protein